MKLLLTSIKAGRVNPLRTEIGSSRNGAHGVARPTVTTSAFTMVEIALALAIIGFALVAIIGVLPAGLNVQKNNREETIITQDATYFMDAIRNGARGLNELTNSVIAITNYWTIFTTTNPLTSGVDGHTYTGSHVTSLANVPDDLMKITNGNRIIGLLTRRKFELLDTGNVRSNHTVAFVRAISGASSEKSPQTNVSVQSLAFGYRMVSEVHDLEMPPNASSYRQSLLTNLHEVRLKFSWPLLVGARVGNGRQTFRSQVGGQLQRTNDFYVSNETNHYFFNPNSY